VVEGEGPGIANGAQSLASIGTAIGLTGILQHAQAVMVCYVHDSIHVRGQSHHMDRNDGLGPWCDLTDDVFGVNGEGGIDLSNDRYGPHRQRCESGGDEGIARDDYLITGADAHAHQTADQGGCAAGNCDCVSHADCL